MIPIVLLALLAQSQPGTAATITQGPSKPETKYSAADLLIAFGTYSRNMFIIEASRVWRKGVRSHITVETQAPLKYLEDQGIPYNETFSAIPDLPGYPVILRHVFALIFAHNKYNGTYKWLLLGDDDTIWNVRGALLLLHDMGVSHEQPFMITDHMYKRVNGTHHELAKDSRCEPCPPGVRYCPCILREACRLPTPGHYHHVADFATQDRNCVIWFQGGSGVVYSSAMMDIHNQHPHMMYQVALSGVSRFSDVIMGETARAAGYGYTSPEGPQRRFGRLWLRRKTPTEELAASIAAELSASSTSVITVHASARRRELHDYVASYPLIAAAMSRLA